jgi:hypothetical protein
MIFKNTLYEEKKNVKAVLRLSIIVYELFYSEAVVVNHLSCTNSDSATKYLKENVANYNSIDNFFSPIFFQKLFSCIKTSFVRLCNAANPIPICFLELLYITISKTQK